MLCGDLNGKEVQKGVDICICMADSFCCTVESNTTLYSNCTPLKLIKKYKIPEKGRRQGTKIQVENWPCCC